MDTLAVRRQSGELLNPATLAVLDQFRPGGPSPSFGLKRPPRPVYPGAPARKPKSKRAQKIGAILRRRTLRRLKTGLRPRVHVSSRS